MPDVLEIILHRRSIRRFEAKQIEETALQQILQAGLYAPSAGGRLDRKGRPGNRSTAVFDCPPSP